MMNQGLVIDMLVGESVVCRHVYRGCELELGGQKLEVDLVPLPLQMFDMILGMDFLTKYQALVDCYKSSKCLLVVKLCSEVKGVQSIIVWCQRSQLEE